jgi:methionyl-tRNA formyltransferase
VAAGHDVALVLTQPDRPAGRGLRLEPSPVKQFATAHGIEVWQPAGLRGAEAAERLRAVGAQAMVVAAYGLILPQSILDATSCALNIHASLLPRWRGAAPIQRALLAGDRETGISIMRMEAALDTGPVLAREHVDITSDEDAGTLHDKLASVGGKLIAQVLTRLNDALANAEPQDGARATYAAKIQKKETFLRWEQPAGELERAVRAFRPGPGAQTALAQDTLKIWRAAVLDGRGAPGTVIESNEAIVVACGEKALAISELQRSGGKRLPTRQFLSGYRVPPGSRFGTPQ